MIFNKLILNNFGVYVGRQEFDLSPDAEGRPIILVGALNGSGKTTFLTAIQLVLYGRLSPSAKEGRQPYEEYLSGKINNAWVLNKEASIELSFTMQEDDGERLYTVKRMWKEDEKGRLREEFNVWIDGAKSDFATQNWRDHMEAILPARIMPLFFFDGEKIEDLADEKKSSEILAAAVNGLLGVDLIDQLDTDLGVFELRKRKTISSNEELAQINSIQNDIDELANTKRDLLQERAFLQARLDRATVKLDKAKGAYAHRGGERYEKKHELEVQLTEVQSKFDDHTEYMAAVVSDVAPLLLIKGLLEEVAVQSDTEVVSQNAEAVLEILALHDKKILDELERVEVALENVRLLDSFMGLERASFEASATQDRYLNMSPLGQKRLHSLISDEISDTEGAVRQALVQDHYLCDQLTQIEKMLLAIPEDDHIRPFAREVEEAKATVTLIKSDLDTADKELYELNRGIEAASRKVRTLIARDIDAQLESEDVSRILEHSSKVRKTLSEFKQRVLERKLGHLEELILKCFDQLSRKKNLINSVEIDPNTFQLKLKGGDQRDLNSNDLSAGERQLLAISILWGLSKASQRRIPAIIDTPLGRLDSTHRKTLSAGYFPKASHQVILLSTDEEIDEAYLKTLERSVCRTYSVEFNSDLGGSEVFPGYLF